MLFALFSFALVHAQPPPQRVEHFDDPVRALRLLPTGAAVVVTSHRVIAMSADGSRENVAPAGCAPVARAAIAPDGAWVALACATPAASGVFAVGAAARTAAIALTGDDRFAFCGGALHVARGPARTAVFTRHPVKAWSDAAVDIDGACAADDTWIAAPAGTRPLGAVVAVPGAAAPAAIAVVGDTGALATVDAPGARRAGPVVARPPTAAARVGDAWVVVDGGKLLTLPEPFASTDATGFFLTPEAHLWVWHGARAERLVWTPSMATQPKLPPAPPVLLSMPVEQKRDFVRFRERELDAIVSFAPSGDDLYGYVLVLSDRRGGVERIDAEACAVAAKHWAERVGREVGAVVSPASCAHGPRANVVKHGSDGDTDEEEGRADDGAERGITFRATTIEGQRVTLAEMPGYGAETELWLWRYDPRTDDFEAVGGGVPPVLALPGEP